jgi:transcriptional regulator with XRE-family HTH domain
MKGFTQQRLADEAGISIEYLAEIESLKRKKSFCIAVLGRITDTLEVDIKKFFDK